MLKQWARNMTWYYEKIESGWCKVFACNLKFYESALCFQERFEIYSPHLSPLVPNLQNEAEEKHQEEHVKRCPTNTLSANGFWWTFKFTSSVWQSNLKLNKRKILDELSN